MWKILSNRVQNIRNNLLAKTFNFHISAWENSKLSELSKRSTNSVFLNVYFGFESTFS